jgi:hypothetical protein
VGCKGCIIYGNWIIPNIGIHKGWVNRNICAVVNCKLLEKVNHNMEAADKVIAKIMELKHYNVDLEVMGNGSCKDWGLLVDALVVEGEVIELIAKANIVS